MGTLCLLLDVTQEKKYIVYIRDYSKWLKQLNMDNTITLPMWLVFMIDVWCGQYAC